jgi:DNA topoisomerase IB
VKRGRGFVYFDRTEKRVEDPEVIERLRGLAIPPAWKEVWICADPLGHLQATGVDAAGRKQYLYHPAWRERRDRQKFDKMLRFARTLPRLRHRIMADLRGEGPTKERVLACATRLLDVGLFRIGWPDPEAHFALLPASFPNEGLNVPKTAFATVLEHGGSAR